MTMWYDSCTAAKKSELHQVLKAEGTVRKAGGMSRSALDIQEEAEIEEEEWGSVEIVVEKEVVKE